MGNILDKRSILDRIKQYYSLKGNAELARFLGVASNTITNWYGRSTFDIDLIYTKCVDMDLNWLLTGRGSMLREDPPAAQTPESTISPVNTGEAAVYYKMYKEKDEEVKAQAQEIGQLKERLRQLEGELVSTEKFQPKASTRSGKIATSGAAGLGGAQFAE